MGFEEHGLRPAEKRVQSQISDSLHQSFPQQTGTLELESTLFTIKVHSVLIKDTDSIQVQLRLDR